MAEGETTGSEPRLQSRRRSPLSNCFRQVGAFPLAEISAISQGGAISESPGHWIAHQKPLRPPHGPFRGTADGFRRSLKQPTRNPENSFQIKEYWQLPEVRTVLDSTSGWVPKQNFPAEKPATPMTRIQQIQRLALCLVVFGGTALISLYIKHRPVLLQDSDLSVTYTVAGSRHHDGKIFRSMFSSPVRFIHLPQAPPEFQWFGFSTSHKTIGQGPLVRDGLFGWNATNPPSIGIALNDPKLEGSDPWIIDFSGDTPSFSSRALAVTVTHQLSQRAQQVVAPNDR